MQKVALVTGASRGIGRAVALRLARLGYVVRVHGRDREALGATCREIDGAGGMAASHVADLSDMKAVEGLAEWATEGGLDVVVHNAAMSNVTFVSRPDFAVWDKTLAVNLIAPMRLTARTLPRVIERKGAFIFIGSIAAKLASAGQNIYCTSKHGLDGFAKSLFEEVREKGVRVVSIHPGFVNTDMIMKGDLVREKMIQPDDIAALVEQALTLPETACPVEMIVRPQRTPYPRRTT